MVIVVVLSLFKLHSYNFIAEVYKHFNHNITVYHAWLCNFQF